MSKRRCYILVSFTARTINFPVISRTNNNNLDWQLSSRKNSTTNIHSRVVNCTRLDLTWWTILSRSASRCEIWILLLSPDLILKPKSVASPQKCNHRCMQGGTRDRQVCLGASFCPGSKWPWNCPASATPSFLPILINSLRPKNLFYWLQGPRDIPFNQAFLGGLDFTTIKCQGIRCPLWALNFFMGKDCDNFGQCCVVTIINRYYGIILSHYYWQ